MKNKESSVKKPRLGYLDLSFEGFKQGSLDNGRRPHGGYRGTKKHPPSALTLDNKEYQRRLGEDLAKLISVSHPTPVWTLEVNKEITHSGESPLFLHNFLSPTKIGKQNARIRCSSQRMSSPEMSGDALLYYRPNRMHQFLTMTEVKDQAQGEVNLRYGRPTRTTLLRARQRSNSAPVNAYDLRREMVKKIEEIKNTCTSLRSKLMHSFDESEDGESEHYFLTGARYNRAHLLDAKILERYGVYMPRDNPKGCFVTGSGRIKDGWDLPSAPPDSPVSDVDDVSFPVRSQRPKTAPGYGRRAPTFERPRQAWTEKPESDADVSEEVVHLPNGIHVQGTRMPLKRTYSPQPRFEDSTLPSVHGISLSRKPKGRENADDDGSVNQPPPSLQFLSSKEDISIYKGTELAETKKEERPPRKTKPILVDRSVNVPSVTSESGRWKDEPYMMVSAIGPQVRIIPPTPQQSKCEVRFVDDSVEQTTTSIQGGESGAQIVLNLGELDVDMKSDGGESVEGKVETREIEAGEETKKTGNGTETADRTKTADGMANVDGTETAGGIANVDGTETADGIANVAVERRTGDDVETVDEKQESADAIVTVDEMGTVDEIKTIDNEIETVDEGQGTGDEQQSVGDAIEIVGEKQTSVDDLENVDESKTSGKEIHIIDEKLETGDGINVSVEKPVIGNGIETVNNVLGSTDEIEPAYENQRINGEIETVDETQNIDVREEPEIFVEIEPIVEREETVERTENVEGGERTVDEIETVNEIEIIDLRNANEEREELYEEVDTIGRGEGTIDEIQTGDERQENLDETEAADEIQTVEEGFTENDVQFGENESTAVRIDSPTADGEVPPDTLEHQSTQDEQPEVSDEKPANGEVFFITEENDVEDGEGNQLETDTQSAAVDGESTPA
ncbi:uncharacterized protein LOC121370676 [Gigantopelta aegis]|uniref:uncharacterized protein LOC121370676 n=1 Tax=Gigantopelta aegis TaxID=1735272 RepID=UPI001B88AFEB|nr:uncharacterized protein LOC121370676 [Gigantopelta aegis]